ncbi:MAG: hypothetical protein LC722_08755 [Actinobacteria bacterium]|nr:hypothetical protein [Actinomycetota bacterium]
MSEALRSLPITATDLGVAREALVELAELSRQHREVIRSRPLAAPVTSSALREHLHHDRLLTNGCNFCRSTWPEADAEANRRPPANEATSWTLENPVQTPRSWMARQRARLAAATI